MGSGKNIYMFCIWRRGEDDQCQGFSCLLLSSISPIPESAFPCSRKKTNQTAVSTNYKDWTSPLPYFSCCSLSLCLHTAHHFLPVPEDLISPALPPQNAQPLLPQTHELWPQADSVCAHTCRGNSLPLEKEGVWGGVMCSLYSFGSKASNDFNAVLTEGWWESALLSLSCGTGVLR